MKLSPLWLSITAALALPALAEGDYALQNAGEVDTSRWRCSGCSSDGQWTGTVGFGAGYSNNGDSTRFNNWVPADTGEGMVGSFNADLERHDDDGFYQKVKVEDLGFDRFLLEGEIGHYDGLRVRGSYSETPYYWNNSSLSAYSGSNNVQTSGDLKAFDKSVTRKKLDLGVKYTPHTPWRPHADMTFEKKEGTKSFYTSAVPGVGSVPGYIQKPIEHETLNASAGVSYLEERWMVDFAYRTSIFRNDYTALYYGPSGDPYMNQFSLEPDNEFHQLALSGNYRWDRQSLTSRVMWSQATSDGGLDAFPDVHNRKSKFKGHVNTWQVDANYLNRLSRKTSLKVTADYRDRDDRSDLDALIGVTRKEYDRTQSRLGTAVDHRFSRSLRMSAGYNYRYDKREYADRERTEDHTLYLSARYRPDADWNAGAKLSYQTRDGSDWHNSNSSDVNLRQYYLADRDRIELRGDANYDVTDNVQLTAEAWYADEQYPTPDVGVSEGQDYGYDLGINFYLENDTTGYAYYNQQSIRSEQQHANSNSPDWGRYSTSIEDDINTVGIGLSRDNLLSKKLDIALDYSYHYGRGRTDTTGSGYRYPNNSSKGHRVELKGDYRLDENQTIRVDMRYENFSEDDYLFNGETANMGDVNQKYDGYFGFVTWEYRY